MKTFEDRQDNVKKVWPPLKRTLVFLERHLQCKQRPCKIRVEAGRNSVSASSCYRSSGYRVSQWLSSYLRTLYL